jgi:hypothetical protein
MAGRLDTGRGRVEGRFLLVSRHARPVNQIYDQEALIAATILGECVLLPDVGLQCMAC